MPFGNPETKCDEVTESRRIQHRSRTEDGSIDPPGHVNRELGQNIDRVRDDQQNCFRGDPGDVRQQGTEEARVAGSEVEPGLARSLLGPCRDDDDIGVGAHRYLIAGFDGRRAHELQSVAEVEHLADRPRPIDIVQRQVPGDAPVEGREGNGSSDISRTDDGQMVQTALRSTSPDEPWHQFTQKLPRRGR